MVWVRLPVYFYKRNETFYFSRSIPSDLQHRFKKRKIEVSLRTKSESKAAKSAAALSDRLERYWDSLRMEMIYSRILQRLRNIFEVFFSLHTSYTLFGWLPVAQDYIVFIVIGCVRCLFCVKILC
ncbi:DUF6538 domain-containing protein [Alphaproteobacteria bacterium LSUCC0226]